MQHNKRKLNEETKPKWSRDHKRLKRKQSVDAKSKMMYKIKNTVTDFTDLV